MNGLLPEYLIGDLLRDQNLKLAVAESCTGGLIGHLLTNVPGSSDYYVGGIVSYANEVKIHTLGVHQDTLEKHGAVSEETVLEMARGVRLTLHADIGLSVSGIAGPGGWTAEKPVGTVWIGLVAEDTEQARHHILDGDRIEIKEQAARQALKIVIEYLIEG